MSGWLISLLQIGGFGAVLVVALIVMGKWLLHQLTAALNSYVTTYAQETAKIDARIERLEKLAEEQARLTRTVESIKDEIAAQAKSRDNRWAFRKEIYVHLVNATSRLIRAEVGLMTCAQSYSKSNDPSELNRGKEFVDERTKALEDFITILNLAPLAVADSLSIPMQAIRPPFSTVDIRQPDSEKLCRETKVTLGNFLLLLQEAGRKDLWGTPVLESKSEAGT
jgi:hypothetical protein